MEILAFNTVFWNIIKTLLILFLFSILYDWVQMFLWKRKYKIKGPFPVPVFGNLLTYIMAPGADHQRKRIEKYGDVFGGPSASVKVLNVANIELLKKIMIKDHVEFQNRFVFPGAFDPPPADKTLLTMEDEVWKRVRSIITPSFSAGKLKQTSRVDLLQLMLNAELQDDENESKITKRLSAEELTGQMFIVIVAGYETTASLLQYVAYVLATNPDVQDKLIAEIDKCISEDVSELKYDVIQDMPYLDQVINETLRIFLY
ncbi:CP341-like protein [Mya arenaria]|uniref:CP341-like protein n=1 Tax=Mya arenaria TaxID=6604 RepID=A0ABY7FPP3_MYAAR|nr:CP341-like protein [Mya arenaria]